MSFKREGDDSGLYNSLKRKRIEELVQEGIPEGEALLTKNGRFACMVCHYRPLFDTAPMLAVHRRGKKHAENYEQYLKRKEELEYLVTKRQHQLSLASSNQDRKTVKDAASTAAASSQACQTPGDTRTLRGAARPVTDTSSQSSHHAGSSLLGKQVKDIIRQVKAECNEAAQPVCVRPYVSKHKRTGSLTHYDDICQDRLAPTVTLTGTGRPQLQKAAEASSQPPSCSPHHVPSHLAHCPTSRSRPVPCAELAVPKSSVVSSGSARASRDVLAPDAPALKRTPLSYPPELATTAASTSAKDRAAEEYVRLRGLGWQRDAFGKWVKEQGVEFDSDDDEPHLEKT